MENSEIKVDPKITTQLIRLFNQAMHFDRVLAEEQAREQALIEATRGLPEILRQYGYLHAPKQLEKLLAIQPENTALEAALAAERERCATTAEEYATGPMPYSIALAIRALK